MSDAPIANYGAGQALEASGHACAAAGSSIAGSIWTSSAKPWKKIPHRAATSRLYRLVNCSAMYASFKRHCSKAQRVRTIYAPSLNKRLALLDERALRDDLAIQSGDRSGATAHAR